MLIDLGWRLLAAFFSFHPDVRSEHPPLHSRFIALNDAIASEMCSTTEQICMT